jgi:hypothetical protein
MSPRIYRSATPSGDLPLPPGRLKIIVGPDSASRRVWSLSKASLARHSPYFAKLCVNPFKHEVTFEDVDPRAFANFASYLHSSIYALNQQVPGFRAIHEATKAHLLGEKIGCKPYADAALRQLYGIFEPLARAPTSNARQCSILASDVEYVCRNTTAPSTFPSTAAPAKEQVGLGLRHLFFDALASHWTQQEILNIGPMMDTPSDTGKWADVYNANTDLRITLASSLNVGDAWRSGLLKGVDDYVDPKTSVAGWVASSSDEGDRRYSALGGGDADDGREALHPRSKISRLKRRNSSDRRMRERARSIDGQGTGERSWRDGIVGTSGGGGDVAVTEEEDWMVLGTGE